MLLAFNGNAQKVGQIKNGYPTITENMDFLKKAWENMLIERKTSAELVNFEIISGKFEKSGESYYLIVASNKSKTLKIATKLVLDKNRFSIKNVSLLSDTCTCSGCRDGCNPTVKPDGNFMCTACIDGGDSCTKTTTL